MFDQCHEALWRLLEARGDMAQTLRLFRHSSFVWRIRGEDDKETKYLEKLRERKPPTELIETVKTTTIELKYFWRRVKIVFVGTDPP